MNTPNSTSEYLFLFRGTDWDRFMSPAEIQQNMSRVLTWFERLSAGGALKPGRPLMSDARIVSGKNGSSVTDGPFAESKEAIGGYFLVGAASLEDAVEIAQQCPMLDFGVTVEIRPIAEDCPIPERLQQRATEEAAMAIA